MLAVSRRQGHAYASRIRPELIERDAARAELLAIRVVDIAVPEVLATSKALSQGENEIRVRPRLAPWRNDARAQLHERLRLGADLEADLEGLALEGGRDRQHDLGRCGGRRHEQVGVRIEVQCGKGPA